MTFPVNHKEKESRDCCVDTRSLPPPHLDIVWKTKSQKEKAKEKKYLVDPIHCATTPPDPPIKSATPSTSFLVSESSCNGSVRSVGWRFLAKSSTFFLWFHEHDIHSSAADNKKRLNSRNDGNG